MSERVRYHEIRSTASSMLRTALFAGERILNRLLVGERPKHVVDLGKTAVQASQVLSVINSLSTPREEEPLYPEMDDMGNYHDPELRIEHTGQLVLPIIERPLQLDNRWDVT